MARSADDIELQVLELIDACEESVGSGTIHLALKGRGVTISQPTIGRLLRTYDHRRWTEKLSNRGRALTERGRDHLQSLRLLEKRKRLAQQIVEAVSPATLRDLRDVLVARRALEREIARLAAIKATPAQISELQAAVREQEVALTAGEKVGDEALRFHLILAEASSNHFLEIAANLIRTDHEPLEEMMYQLGSTVGGDSLTHHKAIAKAVFRGDPEASERAMVVHMDQYLSYVDSLLKKSLGSDLMLSSLSPKR